MAISELITSPADALKRSTYPSIAQPLCRGDARIFRFRIEHGQLSPSQLRTLAYLARQQGASIGITAYGEIEISSPSPERAEELGSSVANALPIEQSLPVACHPSARAEGLVTRLRSGAKTLISRLSPALRIVVDGNGELAMLPADVYIAALPDNRWALTLGGGKPQFLDFETTVSTSLALLSALAALGPEAGASDLFVPYGSSLKQDEPEVVAMQLQGLIDLADAAEANHAAVSILPLGTLAVTANR
jgi:precorrin-3B synthase